MSSFHNFVSMHAASNAQSNESSWSDNWDFQDKRLTAFVKR